MTAPLLGSADLRLFAAIADTGGITAAATRLGLQKSLVSRELQRLEARLRLRLVERTTRRLALTDAGEALARHARRVVEEMEEAEAALASIAAVPQGELTVSAPPAFVRFVLVPNLADFRAAFPLVRLRIEAALRLADLIAEGVEVAIRVGPLPDSGLVARRLGAPPLGLFAAPAYLAARGTPHDATDLAAHDLLGLGRTLDLPGGLTLPVTLSVGDPGAILDMTEAGLGIGPVPLPYASRGLADGRLRQVLPGLDLGAPPIHVLTPSRRVAAPKVRAFVEFAASLLDPTGLQSAARTGISGR